MYREADIEHGGNQVLDTNSRKLEFTRTDKTISGDRMLPYSLKAGKKLVRSLVGPWQHARYGAYAKRGNRVDQIDEHAAPKVGSEAYLPGGFMTKDLNGRDAPIRDQAEPQPDRRGELEVTGFLDQFEVDSLLATPSKKG